MYKRQELETAIPAQLEALRKDLYERALANREKRTWAATTMEAVSYTHLIEPWHSLPGAQTDTQEWSQRAAAACLAPGQTWETTLSTTFER